MFRIATKTITNLVKCRNFSIDAIEKTPHGLDFNRVVLCGTVVATSIHKASGKQVVLLRTTEPSDNEVSIHTVFANTTIDIENGQRMLFKGLLYPSEFIGPDEKTRIRLTTNAFLTKAAFENGSDINHVELYGFIGSNVINNNEGSRFRVVSHHRQKTTGELSPNFYNALIRDEQLLSLTSGLEKNSRVYLSGRMEYENMKDSEGRGRQAGSIVVQQLCATRRTRELSLEREVAE